MEHSRRNHLAKQPAGLAGCHLSAFGRAATNPRTGCKPSSQGFSPDTGGCAPTVDTGQSGATRHRADNLLQSPETMPSRVSGNSRIWSVPRVSPSAYCLPPIPRPPVDPEFAARSDCGPESPTGKTAHARRLRQHNRVCTHFGRKFPHRARGLSPQHREFEGSCRLAAFG